MSASTRSSSKRTYTESLTGQPEKKPRLEDKDSKQSVNPKTSEESKPLLNTESIIKLIEDKKPAEAIECINKALELNANTLDVTVIQQAVFLYGKVGAYAKGIFHINKIIHLGTESIIKSFIEIHFLYARQLLRNVKGTDDPDIIGLWKNEAKKIVEIIKKTTKLDNSKIYESILFELYEKEKSQTYELAYQEFLKDNYDHSLSILINLMDFIRLLKFKSSPEILDINIRLLLAKCLHKKFDYNKLFLSELKNCMTIFDYIAAAQSGGLNNPSVQDVAVDIVLFIYRLLDVIDAENQEMRIYPRITNIDLNLRKCFRSLKDFLNDFDSAKNTVYIRELLSAELNKYDHDIVKPNTKEASRVWYKFNRKDIANLDKAKEWELDRMVMKLTGCYNFFPSQPLPSQRKDSLSLPAGSSSTLEDSDVHMKGEDLVIYPGLTRNYFS